MTNAPLSTAKQARAFVLGGNARFTLRSKASGARYTYRLRSTKDKRILFARLLADNHYTYLGYVRNGEFRLSAKSSMTMESSPVAALAWTLKHLGAGHLPDTLEIWHDGHCGRCGRTLTVPASIASGFGPECINHA